MFHLQKCVVKRKRAFVRRVSEAHSWEGGRQPLRPALSAEQTPTALVTLAAPLHPQRMTDRLLSREEVKQWRLVGYLTYHGRRLNSSLLDDLGKINVTEAARKIRCPLLVIHGDRDETVPVEEAYELYGLIPNLKRLCILQGGDHRFSNPSLLKKALQERAGLDESTAERVVEVVFAHFKEKGLSLLTGSGTSGGGLFGRLFGR